MLKARIILAIAEILTLAFLDVFGFFWYCLETENYFLFALPFIIGFALLVGIDWLISFVKKIFRFH